MFTFFLRPSVLEYPIRREARYSFRSVETRAIFFAHGSRSPLCSTAHTRAGRHVATVQICRSY